MAMHSGEQNRFHPYVGQGMHPDSGSSRGSASGTPVVPLQRPPPPQPLQRPPLQGPPLQGPPLQRPPPHQLQPSLDTIVTTMGTNSALLNRVLTEQENIKTTLNDLVQSSFCIEKSGFKVSNKNYQQLVTHVCAVF